MHGPTIINLQCERSYIRILLWGIKSCVFFLSRCPLTFQWPWWSAPPALQNSNTTQHHTMGFAIPFGKDVYV
ncbi:hypothetical protein M404DRAFT_722049 [Pisolithus tinctorius Marx 270]|uniref:Uncharacterized protein n=1 Tax=Pisolithus tinctorius Marx 270 TaxID=870435 RepID=A0A0C3J550_PISTI|nr:hypothetical protein M404DRAFT_722049 [Pisolithus tinctorius Marx 270]